MIEHSGAVRIKFEDAPTTGGGGDTSSSTEQQSDINGSKSPRGRLRSSNNGTNLMVGVGGVAFKLSLPKEGATSSTSSASSSSNTSPSASSSSSKSPFTPRSMLNKVKHTLSLANTGEADLDRAEADDNKDKEKDKEKGDKEKGEKKLGSFRHKRSRSMGDAKAAAALVPLRESSVVGTSPSQQQQQQGGAPQQQQLAAPGSPVVGHNRSGSTIMRRKGSIAGGSFLSFSSSSTKLKPYGDPSSAAGEALERTGSSESAGDGGIDGDEDEVDAAAATGGDSDAKDGQRRKWGSLQRRNNSLVIKKSSTADGLATLAAAGKRNTIISEASGNRMDRTQRRRYRILVSSPRGGAPSGNGDEAGAAVGDAELDPDATDPPLADDFDSDSDDSAEESIQPVGEERKRSHSLAAGAKGLLKTPRFFQKEAREKRAGNLPQGDSDPVISFRPSLDEGRHRRTNSTDVDSDDPHMKAVHLRYKEMEDLQLGGRERRERNRRLSFHVEEVLSHRPSYDSLVYRGILKEWNEPSYKTLQDFPSHLPPLVWSAGNNTEGRIEGWNVERGASQDFVFGAHSALEDEGYIPFFETHFHKSEYTAWWGVDDKFGPIIVCIQKQPVSAGEAEGEAQSGGGGGGAAEPSSIALSDSGVPTMAAQTVAQGSSGGGGGGGGGGHFGARAILQRLGEKATGGKPAGGLLSLYRVLLQSKKGGKQLFIRSTEKSQEKIKALKTAVGSQGCLSEVDLHDIKFKKLKDLDIREDLLYLEKKFFSTDYKFGVLYAKKGQSENQLFSNLSSDTSPEFERFLALMGEKISLRGFKGYTGGLDIKTDTTGLESVYTEFRNQRIMYHVSTLLPFYPRDEQQVERKRHLGNDIVVIVFQEPGAQFDPTPMKTQFNHIYCVVCAETAEGKGNGGGGGGSTRVRVEFAVKQGVRPFGPPLPDPNETHFQLDNNLREFLLSKLVNSERAALKAPAFAAKLEKTRRIFIEQLIDTRIKKS